MGEPLAVGGQLCPPCRVVHVEWRERPHLLHRQAVPWARVLLDVPGRAALLSVDVIAAAQVAALAEHEGWRGQDAA